MRGSGRDGGFDGVRVTARPRRPRGPRWLLLAVAVFAIVAVGWSLSRRTRDVDARAAATSDASPGDAAVPDAMPRAAAPGVASAGRTERASAAGHAPPDGEDPTLDLADYVLPGEAPAMGEVIAALHARGIRTGLGAFPPPGTSPPLRGLEVPEGFVLPDGYVRHHQATDDGTRIAPILMFAPDRDSIVVGGRRLPIPPDRVVTPELAPPGMPLRWVRIPPPAAGGSR